MFFFNLNIPPDLLHRNSSENDVSILIGENGSGKSQMLALLTKEYLDNGKKVIAISNSIYDKFPDKTRNLHLLRDRSGRYRAKTAIKNALLKISPDETVRFKNVSKALRYVKYDPVIGIENVNISPSTLSEALDKYHRANPSFRNGMPVLNNGDIDELKSLLQKSSFLSNDNVVWLSLTENSFYEIDRISLIQLLKYESVLKKLDIIGEIRLFLRKDGDPIPLYEASSGELSFISSVIYLATTIDENSAVLIDEPENSLHPSWQKDYIKILLELFYLYQPRIVIATHSAIILTGAEVANYRTSVFEGRNFEFTKKVNEPINIEEAFYSYFNVITPENRFLSGLFVDLLNKLTEKKITYDNLLIELDKLREDSFEPKQLEVIDGIEEIAQKINNSTSSKK